MKKFLIRLLEIILLVRIIFSIYKIASYYLDLNSSKKQFDEVSKMVIEIRGGDKEENIKIDDFSEKDKEDSKEILSKLKKMNPDIVGYLEVEGLEINYPVVQSSNNDYYLRRDLNEDYSVAGTIFMDYRNDKKMIDQNTVIYGHNMNNDSMFGSISKLRDQKFVDNNGDNYIRYTCEEGIFIYKMYSYFSVLDDYDYRTPNVENDRWIEFLRKTRDMSQSNFNFDPNFNESTKILTLSTCSTVSDGDYRDAVQAILVDKY